VAFNWVTGSDKLTPRSVWEIGRTSKPNGQSFELFSQLPTEIRLDIWRLALPPPRIIGANYSPTRHEGRMSTASHRWHREEKVQTPEGRGLFYSLFHTCRESRTEALRYYRMLSPIRKAWFIFELPGWAKLPYVDFHHEIFEVLNISHKADFIRWEFSELQSAYGRQLELVRTIAMPEIVIRVHNPVEIYNVLHGLFPFSTKLILWHLPHDGICFHAGHGELANIQYQELRTTHPGWAIQNVEVRDYR
jgi:2EXR family